MLGWVESCCPRCESRCAACFRGPSCQHAPYSLTPQHACCFACCPRDLLRYGELGGRLAVNSPTPASTLFTEMEFGAQMTQCGAAIVGVYAGNESTHLLCGDGTLVTMGFNRKGQAGVAAETDAVYPPQQVRGCAKCAFAECAFSTECALCACM